MILAVSSPSAIKATCDAQEVRRSVRAGVAYLVDAQAKDGTWNSSGHCLGETALAGMALVAGGSPIDDPSVTAAADAVRRMAASEMSTYDNSLSIMFLDRLGIESDSALIERMALRLNQGQCLNGAWTYGLAPGCDRGGDNSNTQFAALAAWVSRRHRIDNNAGLQRLDRYFRNTFDQSAGGWSYAGHGGATPTMTCAGLVGIAIHLGASKQMLADGQSGTQRPNGTAADDPMATRALSSLGQQLRLADKNPAAALNSDLYFFWSLERVAVIYDLREIGGVDWYQWGAKRLVRGQSPNGEWRGRSCTKNWPFEQAVGTSFAILFLSRANVAADLTARVGSGGGVGEAPPGLGGGSKTFRRADSAEETAPTASPPKTGKRGTGKDTPKKPSPEPGVLDPY